MELHRDLESKNCPGIMKLITFEPIAAHRWSLKSFGILPLKFMVTT